MSIKSRYLIVLSIAAVSLTSCGEEPTGKPRVRTYPIRGRVTVDGQPGGDMLIRCVTSNSPVRLTISGFSDREGNFTIGTYEKQDGAPVGTYKLTFMWGQRSLWTGRYGGPDKLRGLYTDPEKSEFTVTVEEGEPIDLGDVQLSLASASEAEEVKPDFTINSESGE